MKCFQPTTPKYGRCNKVAEALDLHPTDMFQPSTPVNGYCNGELVDLLARVTSTPEFGRCNLGEVFEEVVFERFQPSTPPKRLRRPQSAAGGSSDGKHNPATIAVLETKRSS